jgi:hypothetical protein
MARAAQFLERPKTREFGASSAKKVGPGLAVATKEMRQLDYHRGSVKKSVVRLMGQDFHLDRSFPIHTLVTPSDNHLPI